MPVSYFWLGGIALAAYWINTLLVVAEGLQHFTRAQEQRRRLLDAKVQSEPTEATLRITAIAHALHSDDNTWICRERDVIATPFPVLASRTRDSFEYATDTGSLAETWAETVQAARSSKGASVILSLSTKLPAMEDRRTGACWVVLPGAREEIMRAPKKVAALLIAIVGCASVCCALLFVGPLFGFWSKIAALLCLAFFLGVQPLTGTMRRWASDLAEVREETLVLTAPGK